ncbi:MAG: hypothetical protein RIQ93_2029 [Verrucomicrobiota bacterium]|jgi:N-acetylglucosamine-6-sulfatase
MNLQSTSSPTLFGSVKLLLAALALCLGATLPLRLSRAAQPAQRAAQPNVIFIVVDDLRWDEMGYAGHPYSRTPSIDRIAHEGVHFRNAFATTPLCSPSRATILTGLYAHRHGITDNTDRSAASHQLATFPQALQRVGYATGFVGKWHMGNDNSARPGFDQWVCLLGQGSTLDAVLNVNGKTVNSSGYVTDVLTSHALEFLRTPRKKPFLLYFAHKALHPETVQRADGSLSDPNASNFIPAERHKNLYAGVEIPRRPNALDAPEGKPALLRQLPGVPPLSRATGSSDETILSRQRMLAAVDESTGEILKALEASGELDRTIVIVTSDHGYFYGEHGLSVERRLAYEESIRIPVAMRYPPLIKAAGKRDQMIVTTDFAPTLLELAGAPADPKMQGRSLVPLLREDGPEIRDAFLIEYYTDTVFPRMNKMGYQAVRTRDWKYIHYVDLPNSDELYDMNRDPYEMRNLAATPRAAPTLQALQGELAKQLQATGAAKR